jgi:hypothetical protein
MWRKVYYWYLRVVDRWWELREWWSEEMDQWREELGDDE